jgi:hypothetical protein
VTESIGIAALAAFTAFAVSSRFVGSAMWLGRDSLNANSETSKTRSSSSSLEAELRSDMRGLRAQRKVRAINQHRAS